MHSDNKHAVIPGRAKREPGTQGQTHRPTIPWVPDRAEFILGPAFGRTRGGVRNDGAKLVALSVLVLLSSCSTVRPGQTPPHRLPTHGAIAYTCANGAQLMVDYAGDEARVAIIGGPSMVLPQTGEGAYSNGRYGLSGTNAQAQWSVGRSSPVSCRGN